MNRMQQRGISIIEVAVVLVILGAIVAVALPRIASMQRESRIAKLNAARTAIGSASATIFGAAMTRQNQTQPPCGDFGTPGINAAGHGTVCTETGLVAVTLLYPAASMNGVIAASGLANHSGPLSILHLNAEGYSTSPVAGGIQVQVLGGVLPANCSFSYLAPTALGHAASVSSTITSGC